MLQLNSYSLQVKNNQLLKNVNIEFAEGKINHILGKNGVGKSIFAKNLMMNRDDSIVIGSYSNIPEDLAFYELYKVLVKNFGKKKVDQLSSVLNVTNIDPKIIIKKLSDGQRQKIKLLVFLLFDRDVIILDEITNALDKSTSREIYALFNSYIENNPHKVILNITHNLSDLKYMEGNYYLFDKLKLTKYEDINTLIDMYINGD